MSASKIGGAYLEGKTDINDAAYDLGKIYELVKDRSEGDYEPSYLIAELRTQIMDGSVESAEIALENLILMASIDESQIY